MTYKHTLKLRRESRVIRFYFWLYRDASIEKIDFCKLFWGVMLSPLVMLFFGALIAILGPIAWIIERNDTKPTPPKPSIETPSRVGMFFSKPTPRRVAKALLIVVGSIAGVALVGGIGIGLYRLIVTGYILYVLVGVIALLVIGGLIGFTVRAGHRGRFDGIAHAASVSYYALKTNTCPKVEVK